MPRRRRELVDVGVVSGVAPRGEERRLRELAAWVGRTYVEGALGAALTVGRRLLDEFYDGDAGRWRAVGLRHPSVQALSGMLADTLTPVAYAATCLHVTAQMELLEERVGLALPLAHHLALLPMKARGTKRQLAAQALAQGWSSKALRTKVQARLGPAPRRGPKPKPRLVQAVKGVDKVLDALRLEAGELTAMDDRVFEAAVEGLEEAAGRLLVLAREARRIRGDR